MRNLIYPIYLLTLVIGCEKPNQPTIEKIASRPVLEESGKKIIFPNDAQLLSYFEYDTVNYDSIRSNLNSSAIVAVTTGTSQSGRRNLVLFNDPELESVYSQFLQHLININTYKINKDRLVDLSHHGAASGKEVLEAETELANEEAALTEEEGKLKIAGLDPDKLRNPASQQAWLLCEVPEIQIRNISIGDSCSIKFTAYPDQIYAGTVDGISSEVDIITRMYRVRVLLTNESEKFKVGMFAQANFQSKIFYTVVVPVSAICNVQGKDFVFVKTGKTSFERKEIVAGFQSENEITVLRGLKPREIIVTRGTMALKGISFGY